MGPAIELALTRKRPRLLTDDPELFRAASRSLEELLRRDVANILSGIYPVEVLLPENPLKHLLRLPEMFREGVQISLRRQNKKADFFAPETEALLKELPEYYRRNFHFQGSGYLSARSARLYEHQVDILFAGSADAMRRMIIEPLRERFGSGDGEGLSFLEIGAGTGRATLFVRLAFPRAKICCLDLSAAYLKKAQEQLAKYSRHDFVEGDGARLPFQPGLFDAVFSVFLFHELPQPTRLEVLKESMRVLRPGGLIGLVDSLQLGDTPALDGSLQEFPKQFHEPFYANYIRSPMEALLASTGVESVQSKTGFFSKVCSGLKVMDQ